MTQDQVKSLVRLILGFLGGVFVTKGLLSANALADLIDKAVNAVPAITAALGAILPIASAVWSMRVHSTTGQIAAGEKASLPGTTIVTTPAIAAAIDSPKVVSK